MKNQPDQKFLHIHRNIRKNFDFLFKRDFHITGFMFMDDNNEDWGVIMNADDLFIRIRCIQGRVDLGFTTMYLFDKIGLLDLESMLQFIGEGNDMFYAIKARSMNEQQQIKSIAQLLRRYFNELITQFDDLNPLTLDQIYPIQNNSIKGQLSKDNCPFILLLTLVNTNFFIISLSIIPPSPPMRISAKTVRSGQQTIQSLPVL